MSRLRISDERLATQFKTTPKGQDVQTFFANTNDNGTWQMWKPSPLGQDGLGLVSGTPSWLLPPGPNGSNKEDIVHPSFHTTVALVFTKVDPVLPGTLSPQKGFLGSGLNSGIFSPVSGSINHDPWSHNAFFKPLSGGENQERLAMKLYMWESKRSCGESFIWTISA